MKYISNSRENEAHKKFNELTKNIFFEKVKVIDLIKNIYCVFIFQHSHFYVQTFIVKHSALRRVKSCKLFTIFSVIS